MNPQPNPLLMRCSVEELRHKLSIHDAPLAPWWQHFLTLARMDDWLTPYPVLAAIVTEQECDRRRAREVFLRFLRMADEGNGSLEAQFHTHVTAAPLGRWAIFYDWVADLELFTAEEDVAIRAAMLDHAFVFPLQALQGRIRAFDNQILSNAFGAAAVGYVFGIKRGDSALGRRLFSSGLGWLLELLKRLPKGGYSGEGSTYQEHVVLPMVLLAALLVEETTGTDVINDGVTPGPPALELLKFTHQLIGPAGLLPAWDDHGFQAASVKSPLVYLARETGDQRPLATIREHEMWYRLTLPAWETDDRLWSLVWWPDEPVSASVQPEYSPWIAPRAAGALQNVNNRFRLFQYWDICGGLLQAARLQTDANAITLEAFGSPLLVDGHGQLPPELSPLPATAREYIGERGIEMVKEYRGQSQSDDEALRLALSGGIGLSNSLFLDGEDWYVPEQPCTGKGEALHQIGPLQVLRSGATDFYTSRYDVESVQRTSINVAGRYALVCDRMRSRTEHRVTWQAFLRQEATAEGERIVVRTPEQVRCDVIPLQSGKLDLTAVEGYPASPIGRSARLRQTSAPSTHPRFDFALIPQALYEEVLDLTGGWLRNIEGDTSVVSLDSAYLFDPATEPNLPRGFRRHFSMALQPVRKYFVSVHLASRCLNLQVNAQKATPTFQQKKGIWKESSTFLPHFFDVTDLLRDGENEIELTAAFFHGESVAGPVRLLMQREPVPVDARCTGDDTISVSTGTTTDDLIVERTACAPWLGGETDARHAVYTGDGDIAAAAVTYLQLPGTAELHSQPACDILLKSGVTELCEPVFGTRLTIEYPQCRLRMEYGACLEVTFSGQFSHQLVVPWPDGRTVIVNGEIQSTLDRSGENIILQLTTSKILAETPHNTDGVYALLASGNEASAALILESLSAQDWRVQTAAADAAGRLGLCEAAPKLLQLFHEAEAELPYPELTKWWRWSKMLMTAKGGNNGADPTLTELGIKRWRVKRAVVTALGLLGDQQAIAAFEATMTRCDDYFPVTSQLAVALGRLGSPSSIAVLEQHIHHAEMNTRVHANLAVQLLKGEIDRRQFEEKIGLQ